ncbi:MAG: glycosyltransferase family 2 protein [Leadbetterella sp.]|nr:glycosyltransferase family 2 protein [Leadbetterella sp.]
MKTALLISTYNWPQALKLCLDSLVSQTVYPDEVLIADDGSRPDTGELIREFQNRFSRPVKHIWHEDEGFRLSGIRNKALLECRADYVIQVDGDVIMERHFIEDHIRFAQKNSVVVGSRASLGEDYTAGLLATGKLPSKRELDRNSSNFLNSRRIPWLTPMLSYYHTSGKNQYYAKGCNMAFWLEDMLAVNGYDESFVGWGREDSDLVVRLLAKGCFLRRIKMSAVQYHIYHKENDRYNEETNDLLMKKRIEEGSYFADNGILKSGDILSELLVVMSATAL